MRSRPPTALQSGAPPVAGRARRWPRRAPQWRHRGDVPAHGGRARFRLRLRARAEASSLGISTLPAVPGSPCRWSCWRWSRWPRSPSRRGSRSRWQAHWSGWSWCHSRGRRPPLAPCDPGHPDHALALADALHAGQLGGLQSAECRM